jgi:hypothetical protein
MLHVLLSEVAVVLLLGELLVAALSAACSSTESVPLGSLYTMGDPRV